VAVLYKVTEVTEAISRKITGTPHRKRSNGVWVRRRVKIK